MKTLTKDAFAAAERYLVLNARLIDRLRFQHHFDTVADEQVLDVLGGYQDIGGGFGNAIEPDLRGALGQPQGIEQAFWILDEIEQFHGTLVQRACDWLTKFSTADGGVPWVLPSVVGDERGPWWQPQGEQPPAALNPTAPIVGLLHANGVEHRWVGPATEFCWRSIAGLEEVGAYDAMCVLAFLERVPDRERAGAEFARLHDSLRAAAAIDPNAEGHVHTPLDLAGRPDSLGRGLFSEEEIDLHLDVMVDAQNEDGGWAPNFQMWTPVVAHEWGGILTLGNLLTLEANGRIA